MDNSKTIHQLNEEQEARIKERGEANAVRKQTRAIKRGDLSGTDAGLNAAEKVRDGVVIGIQEAIAGFIADKIAKRGKTKTPPGWLIQLQNNPIEVTAELALRVCLDAAGADFSHSNTIMHLGEAIEASVLNYHLRNSPGGKQLLKLINSSNEVEGGSVYTMRQRAIYIASKKPQRPVRNKKGDVVHNEDGSIMLEDDPTKFAWHKWDDSLKAKVGGILMAGVEKGAPDLFEFVGAKEEWTDKDVINRIQLTEYAEENLTAELEYLTKQSPMHAPMFNKPNNWGVRNVGPYNTLSLNVLTPIVKNMSPAQETAVNNAMLDGSLNRAMSALNTLQRVPYTLSETVVEVVRWAEKQIVDSNGEIKVEGFPSISKVKAVDEKDKAARDKMSPDQRKEYFTDLTSRKKHNREVKANKLALRRRLQEAKYLLDQQKNADRFYLPMNWDFRGRIYHLAEFGFQNTDYLRAMFMFANKGRVTKKNEHHLLRHLANLYGGGVDKEDHAAREAWARDNMDKILAVGADPKAPDAFDFWRTCDEPFQFMNACVEMYNYHQHGEGYETGLPIAKDATQSGIQFYAVLGRNSEDGRKVNVAPQNTPGDLYTNVRDAAEELLHEDIERLEALKEAAGGGELTGADADDLSSAYAWRSYGLTRSLMKSPTMTWAYSSDLYGFAKVIRDKIMKELTRDVRQNRLAEHPFDDEGFHASWYMAKLIKKAIVQTVKSAAEGMKYLRDVASICTDNKMQFAYNTPLNFPMMQYCRNEKENAARIELSKWDGASGRLKAGKVQITQYLDSINRDHAMNGASPNFIHSLDATLLMEAVMLCKSRGITDIMPVHDSFSTTIDNVDMMLDAIKTSFVGLFAEYCPYDALMQQTVQRIADRTKLPDHGDLDIQQLMDSEYAFS